MRRRHLLQAGGAALAGLTRLAEAQSRYPDKPLRIITPFGAGQGPDVLLRLIAARLQARWNQPVVVDNRPGASGFLAFEAARHAAPDGLTLVHMDSFHIGTQPHLFKRLPYDAFKDFTPITPLVRNAFFVVVAQGARWRSVGELLAAARGKADALSYGSWSVASPAHLGGMLLESAAGVQMLHVPFKEPSQLYGAVASGEVDFAFGSAVSTRALVEAGKLRLMALAAPRRLTTHGQVPTVAESGGPAGFELAGWNGLLAPAGTPGPAVEAVNRTVRDALASPEIREKLVSYGYESHGMDPLQMAALMQAEVRQWGPVITRAGLRLD